jgi:hypothetical protein
MKNIRHQEDKNNQAPPIEQDYEAHQDNPGPAPTVNEQDNKGAGQMMKWIIPIIVLVLIIVWLLFFGNNTTKP